MNSSKKNHKVLLILTHRRLGNDPTTLISVGAGWHTHLGILTDRLEGNQTEGFWSVHVPLEEDYKQLIRKQKTHFRNMNTASNNSNLENQQD